MQLWMYEAQKRNDLHPLPVSMTLRSHLFSYRTQKLSSVVQKVLGWTRPGRICRCRFPKEKHTRLSVFFLFYNGYLVSARSACRVRQQELANCRQNDKRNVALICACWICATRGKAFRLFFCLKWFEMANLILVGNLQKGALDRKRRHQKKVLGR